MRRRRPGLIDAANPVNRHYPGNIGKMAWYLALPPFMGGAKFRNLMDQPDLVRGTHGVLTSGPTWRGVRGRSGGYGSLDFDGSDDYVDISGVAPSITDLTVAAWVRPASAGADHDSQTWFSWGNPGQFGGGDYSLYASVGGGHLNIFVGVGTGTWLDGTVPVATGAWSRVVIVLSDNNRLLYTNGHLDTSGVAPLTIATTAKYIGKRVDGLGGPPFDGIIDDVVVSRSWSAAEVLRDYVDSSNGYRESLNWLSGTSHFTRPSFRIREHSNTGTLAGTTEVTIVPAPAGNDRHIVKCIYVANIDTAAVTVTVKYKNSGDARVIVRRVMQPGDTMVLKKNDLYVLDSTVKSIVAVMSGAAATTNPDFVASYADVSSP